MTDISAGLAIKSNCGQKHRIIENKPLGNTPIFLSTRQILKRAAIALGFAAVSLMLTFGQNALAADTPPAMAVLGQTNVGATGAFTYKIPIAVPPGTGGMVPALSLEYSSQASNGVVGLGWSLSGLSSITRCPRTIAQDAIHGGVNYDNNDRFCIDGQRLIAISGTYGANGTEYRTEIDSFSKIISYGTAGNGPAYFKVWTKSGQIMEFGNTTDSRVLAVGKSTARAWSVNKISDTAGNYLTVTYNSSTGTDRTTNGEIYPVRIDYTGNSTASLATYNSVQFTYDSSRPDETPTYQAGALQETTVLLTHVKTYQGSSLVSDYRLAYDYGSSTDPSELASITLCDGSQTPICLAPTSFSWQGNHGALPTMTSTSNSTFQEGTQLATEVDLVPGDFNGDGITDLYFSGSTNVGPQGCSGNLGPDWSTLFSISGSGCGDGTYGVQTWDYDGDGYADIIGMQFNTQGKPRLHYFHNTHTQFSIAGLFNPSQDRGADFNGDGRSDYLIIGTTTYAYLSNGDGTFTADGGHSGLQGLLATRIPSDFDGDGCADVMVQGSGYTPIISFFCNPAVTQASVPNWIASGYALALADFNGDGKTDVFRSGNGDPGALFLSNGTGINTAATWTSSAISWGKYAIYTGDFNGDGKPTSC